MTPPSGFTAICEHRYTKNPSMISKDVLQIFLNDCQNCKVHTEKYTRENSQMQTIFTTTLVTTQH